MVARWRHLPATSSALPNQNSRFREGFSFLCPCLAGSFQQIPIPPPFLHVSYPVSIYRIHQESSDFPCFFPRAFPGEIESSRAAEKNGSSGRAEKPFFVLLCMRACVCVCVCVCVGFAHMVRYSIFEEFQSPNRMRLFFHTKIREHLHLPRNGRFLWFYSRDTFDVGYHLLVNNSWEFLME